MHFHKGQRARIRDSQTSIAVDQMFPYFKAQVSSNQLQAIPTLEALLKVMKIKQKPSALSPQAIPTLETLPEM
jgi:hypothetical protein